MHRRALHVCNVRRHCARPYSHLTRLTQHIGIAQQFVLQLLEAPTEMQGGFTWIVLALLLTSLNMSLTQGVFDSVPPSLLGMSAPTRSSRSEAVLSSRE
jgi:hypothetical protein